VKVLDSALSFVLEMVERLGDNFSDYLPAFECLLGYQMNDLALLSHKNQSRLCLA
jgi:hypothetical protein